MVGFAAADRSPLSAISPPEETAAAFYENLHKLDMVALSLNKLPLVKPDWFTPQVS